MTQLDGRFSIGIPVHGGKGYVVGAVQTILRYCSDLRELVVSLSPTDWDIARPLEDLNSKKLRVMCQDQTLSMKEHFESVLRELSGEWVTILGQDDGLLPSFDRVVSAAMQAMPGLRAYTFARAYYWWPNALASNRGRIDLSQRATHSIRESQEEIWATLQGQRQHFQLPQIYTNCLVHQSVIQELRSRETALVYQEWSPDLYSGVAVASHIDYYGYSGTPAFWTGTSSVSTGLKILQARRGSSDSNKQTFEDEQNLGPLTFSEYFYLQSSALWTLGTLTTLGNLSRFPGALDSAYGTAYAENLPLCHLLFGKSKEEARRNRKELVAREVWSSNPLKAGVTAGIRYLPGLIWSRLSSALLRRWPLADRTLRGSFSHLDDISKASNFVACRWP